MIKRISKWIVRLALLLVFLYVFSTLFVYFYSFKDDTRKADAVIVLGAAVWFNKPSPVLKERIDHGIDLYKKGYAKKIIFTGGKYNAETPSESSISKKYAIKQGVPANDIYIEESSRITEQNLQNAKHIMDHEHLKNALIVSDPYHMRRAMTMAAFTGIKAFTSPTEHSAYRTWGKKLPFLSHEGINLAGYVITYPARWINHNYIKITWTDL
ncbi:hypothetical protein A374_00490 [Fictibacillus macauensis ZFHKF-1]|uniref:DUF218 domain-containing protein n=1 Tax=Fictibacillus macauensis ZFHKF-1 TaxID=1196324 RepID=I8J6G1_9BACL|nr:YdcF family protein [Fictibacillus macauensis]EIT87406.1 hypothetical protein A374_00490 [Fictibacillus macauensis ZFHKF-1]